MSYLFVLDVSYMSVSTGALGNACAAILQMLDAFPVQAVPGEDGTTQYLSTISVGFVTFDRHVQFYSLVVRYILFVTIVVG